MKILGSDYDGTLNHGGMYDEKFAAIQKWRENGNKFGIVTGRSPGHREYLAKEHPALKYDFLAACNGGVIIDPKGNVIFESRCEDVPLYDLASDLFSWGCFEAHVDGKRPLLVLQEFDGEALANDKKLICSLEKVSAVDYFNQVSVQLPSDREAAEVARKVKQKYRGRLNALINGVCIDIVPAGVSKSRGMYRVMEHFGCAYENVITVGDNINDIDMLREFYSYGMESGVSEIFEFVNGTVNDVTEIFKREA